MSREAEIAVIGVLLLLQASPALAQSPSPFFPTELSVGFGGVVDVTSGRSSPDLSLGVAMIVERDQWIEPAIEMGFGGTSDFAMCPAVDPLLETCPDAYMMAGTRLRPLRRSDRWWRPFVNVLIGAYWTGTGMEEDSYLPGVFAFQSGGGIDIRSPKSAHGVRFSSDYRHVFADVQRQNQLRVVVSYFVGWRGEARPDFKPERRVPRHPGGV